MQDRIAKGLERLFDEHRIVFWFDENQEMGEVFEKLSLDGVEKIAIRNDEFQVKYRILKQEPEQNFLIYRNGPEPEMIDNWLLDVQLASAVFAADQVAMWLNELGLPLAFRETVKAHEEFFRSRKRIDDLKKILKPEDTTTELRMRMLSVCCDADGGFDTAVEGLLSDLVAENDGRLKLVGRAGLERFLWDQMGRNFSYHSEDHSLEDFAITLFKSAFEIDLNDQGSLNNEASVFFKRWKNSKKTDADFEALSKRFAPLLCKREDLASIDFLRLMPLDHFEEIDREIIRSMVAELSDRTLKHSDVMRWCRERRGSHWYKGYLHVYEAIGHAAEFQQALADVTLGMTSFAEGIQRYARVWYRIDQLYRKFIYHMQQSRQASLMADLNERVENLYSNSFLMKLNDAWQVQIDAADRWRIAGVDMQADFYQRHVRARFRDAKPEQKICVIISDALRYEVAEELLGSIRGMDKFEASISPMVGCLPSYTQLGMASLLPHTALSISEDDTKTVFEGTQSTQGRVNRDKVLAAAHNKDRTLVSKFVEFMGISGTAAKEMIRDHDVIYIYHNQIDAVGDKLNTEERVFKAAEDTVEEITKLVKKLASSNASSILITADHGFLYQNKPIAESDFSSAEVTGEAIYSKDRRFVTGCGLQETHGLKRFTSKQLELQGNTEVLIPNSINRLRQQGSGSRYVHGGASLQEIVVPLIEVGKKRKSDVSKVEVEILAGGRSIISSSQLSVIFYQKDAVTEKTTPRTLSAGIYSSTNELISNEHEIEFDLSENNAREREIKKQFLLTKHADDFEDQQVFLILKERQGKTSYFEKVAQHPYTLRRGMGTDFDL